MHLLFITLIIPQLFLYESRPLPEQGIPYFKRMNSIRITLLFGNPPMNKTVLVDINSKITYVLTRGQEDYDSTTMKTVLNNTNLNLRMHPYNGSIVQDTIRLFSNDTHTIDQLKDFTFFLMIEENKNLYKLINSIGLPFKPQKPEMSLLHQLKAQGVIDHLSFSLDRIDKYNGRFYFGGIPNESITNLQHSYCNVSGLNNHWDCSLSQMRIHNSLTSITYNSTDHAYVYFSTSTNMVYAPSDYIDFLVEMYFKPASLLDQCNIIYNFNEPRLITCESAFITLLGNITFTIDGFEYEFSFWNFWSCFDECVLEIGINDDGNNWVIGLDFFKDYSLLFDHEESKIHFYSHKQVKRAGEVNGRDIHHLNSISIFLSSCTVLLIGLAVLGNAKYKLIKHK